MKFDNWTYFYNFMKNSVTPNQKQSFLLQNIMKTTFPCNNTAAECCPPDRARGKPENHQVENTVIGTHTHTPHQAFLRSLLDDDWAVQELTAAAAATLHRPSWIFGVGSTCAIISGPARGVKFRNKFIMSSLFRRASLHPSSDDAHDRWDDRVTAFVTVKIHFYSHRGYGLQSIVCGGVTICFRRISVKIATLFTISVNIKSRYGQYYVKINNFFYSVWHLRHLFLFCK